MPPNSYVYKEPGTAFYTTSHIVLKPNCQQAFTILPFLEKYACIKKSFLLTCDLINQNP